MLWMINLLNEILCFNSNFASIGMEEPRVFSTPMSNSRLGDLYRDAIYRLLQIILGPSRARTAVQFTLGFPISEKVVPDSTRVHTWLDRFVIYFFSSLSYCKSLSIVSSNYIKWKLTAAKIRLARQETLEKCKIAGTYSFSALTHTRRDSISSILNLMRGPAL